MKAKTLAIALFLSIIASADSVIPLQSRKLFQEYGSSEILLSHTLSRMKEDTAFAKRSLALRQKLAERDLDELNIWWRKRNIGDPHKYLLPVILSRLSLPEKYDLQHTWNVLLNLERNKSDLYHFRSIFDIRIFFLFRDILPNKIESSYRSMLQKPRVLEWDEGGTENHAFMQRASGLAFMNGSGWPVGDPATTEHNEAWLRSQLNKLLTIGQGEFHSSTYYGYSIGGLLNLYDFARTPELRQIAKAHLDWLATNMAVRLSWGTAGGAESRGFDRGTWDSSELSIVAWVWWGDDTNINEVVERTNNKARVALLAALSDYRPPSQLKAIARKKVTLPFVLNASHPGYYSHHRGNRFWETFYVAPNYSLGTLLNPQRSYRVKGTINAQYATYKLVVRDPKGKNNAVISLGGTYHTPMATGSSPGDQYLQERGAVIYQLRLNDADRNAEVPGRSHLVLPARYGEPQRHGDWYIWRIEGVWLCARPWGETINWQARVSEKRREKDYQALAAIGTNTAWITDIASIADYPDFKSLTRALDRAQIDDRDWETNGRLAYRSLEGDRLEMTYEPNGGVGRARIDGRDRILKDWPVLDSPYVRQELNSGVLDVVSPEGNWRLRATPIGPIWEN